MYDTLRVGVWVLLTIQVGMLVGLLLRTKKVLGGQVDQNKRLLHRLWQLREDNSELRKEISRLRAQFRGLTERRRRY